MTSSAQRRKQKEKERRARLKNQIRLQRLANNRLSGNEEQQAVETCKHLHRCLMLLRGEIKVFLASWGLAPRRDEDTSTMLRNLIDYNEIIPTFISLTPNRVEIDKRTLLKAVYAGGWQLPRIFVHPGPPWPESPYLSSHRIFRNL
ncbi:hypothetical protein DAPPUDRAFT_336367 [Daphnia pulex]|uniref:Uncharacterized protein n=1 Tax=Daphnia pulex TaxID=6669 RepID=E9HZJ4_DAPPU|nr:hypothetical protein DAPPUDRAFT_336367 [Daphnia pulex]|eukprot:EFX62836.1 hypothetical protein DAPPUDRAFT_336367 [Daphnia pulex]